jgi:hypothetical protein
MRTEFLLPVTGFLVMAEVIWVLIAIAEPRLRHYVYLTINSLVLMWFLKELFS